MAKRILIVDDAPIMRTVLEDIITRHGYEIVGQAANGDEAIAMYKELKPDLVTLDIVMPQKGGIEALRGILEFDSNAKVVVVSALDQRELLMEAINLGATDYIVKPFKNERVVSAIQKVFGELDTD